MLRVNLRDGSSQEEMIPIPKPKKSVVFNVVHPDQSAYILELPFDSTGQDCLDKVNPKLIVNAVCVCTVYRGGAAGFCKPLITYGPFPFRCVT